MDGPGNERAGVKLIPNGLRYKQAETHNSCKKREMEC